MADKVKSEIKYSVQLKFVATFFATITALIILMNTYPIFASRDLVFTAKQSSLLNHVTVMSSSLSPLDTLTVENINQVMELLGVTTLSRVIITDDKGLILYDTADVDPNIGRYALFSEINQGLRGNLVFYSKYDGNAFMSKAAAPVKNRGMTIGCVYLYEYDTAQAQLIAGIQSNIRNISIAVIALSLILIFVYTKTLTRRITDLVRAVRVIREGEYDYRIRIKGNDELTELGEEFNTLTDRLQKTEEVRRRFVSDASHELKTPLAAIRLLSESILQSENMGLDTIREFVDDIGNEAERLQRTSDKLLNLTRLDHDSQLTRTRVNINRVVESTLHLLSPLADKKDVSLKYELLDVCDVFASEDDLYQIIFNLVENGIKYNQPGGQVRLLLVREEDEAAIYIDDTGIGIPQEDIPHIFSRFYRVDKARSREAGGSGLGLSIVRDAIILHGGTVKVQPGEEGTRFIVRFPLCRDQEETK